MSVSTQTNRAVYSGDGVATLFSFPYYLRKNTDLKVKKISNLGVITLLVLNTDYTLAFVGPALYNAYPGGCTITTTVAPGATDKIILYRDPDFTQEEHWTDNDPMPASSSENSIDKAIVLAQRVKDLATRSIRLKDGYAATFDPELPSVITPDYFLAVNPTGDGLVLTPGIAGPTGPTGPAGSSGGSGLAVSSVNANGSEVAGSPVDGQHIAIDASGGAVTRTLPQALVGIVGQVFHYKKIDNSANNGIIAAFAGDAILSTALVASLTLDYQGKCYSLVCRDVGVWDVI